MARPGRVRLVAASPPEGLRDQGLLSLRHEILVGVLSGVGRQVAASQLAQSLLADLCGFGPIGLILIQEEVACPNGMPASEDQRPLDRVR